MKYRDMTVDVPESMRRLLFEGCEMPEELNEKDIGSEFETFEDGKLFKVRLPEKVDKINAPELADILSKAADRTDEIVIDCEECEYINSGVLKALLDAQKKLAQKHGTLELERVGKNVGEILKNTGFDEILQILDEDAAQMNPDGSIGRQGRGSGFYKKCQGAAEARTTYVGPQTCAEFGWSRKNWIDIGMKEIAKAVKAFRAESAASGKGNLEYLRFRFSDGGDMLIVPAKLQDKDGEENVVMKFVKASQIKGTFFNPTDEFCDGRKHPGNGAFLSDMKAAKMKLTDFQDLVVEDTGHYLYPAKLSWEKKPDSVEIVVSYKPYKGSPSPAAAKEGPFVDELYQYMLNSDKPATSVVQVANKVNEIQKVK